jgi:hypothetical protein
MPWRQALPAMHSEVLHTSYCLGRQRGKLNLPRMAPLWQGRLGLYPLTPAGALVAIFVGMGFSCAKPKWTVQQHRQQLPLRPVCALPFVQLLPCFLWLPWTLHGMKHPKRAALYWSICHVDHQCNCIALANPCIP